MATSSQKFGSMAAPLIVRHSVSEQVLSEMRKRIINGDLPAGNLLTESFCANLLSVSRVPVREAMMALEKEGLIERDGRGRTVVRRYTLHDYQEILSLRQELESMGARLAATHRSEEHLAALEENIESFSRAENAEELARIDVDFHRLLIFSSGHQWLLRAWNTICSPYQWLLTRNFRAYIRATSLNESKISTEDHRRILEAIRQNKPIEAELLMQQHISRWTEWTPPLE